MYRGTLGRHRFRYRLSALLLSKPFDILRSGEVSEWFKVLLSKSSVG